MAGAGFAGSKIGGVAGSPIPIVGNVVGLIGGFGMGALGYVLLDVRPIGSYTVREHLQNVSEDVFEYVATPTNIGILQRSIAVIGTQGRATID